MKSFVALALFLTTLVAISNAYRPVVLMHGIGTDKSSLDGLESWIREALPGVYVVNIEIGNGKLDSIFKTMNEQVDEYNRIVSSDPQLADGFNAIGFSQGTLVTRGYIQRYNSPKVHNFVSMNGPQAGQFGTPYVNIKWIDEVLSTLPYERLMQHSISACQYWKDPYNNEEYLAHSLYLADINNERTTKNQTYVDNITSLNSMVLSYSTEDDTIVPRESGWFGFYAEGTQKKIVTLQESPLYTEDWIGLKTLDQSNRLHFFVTDCEHKDHPSDPDCKPFFTNYTLPWLIN
eukprot:gene9754-11981_t